MKKGIIFSIVLLLTMVTKAQVSYLDSAKKEILRINKVFDSSSYLGFDVDINYESDSVGGSATDQMSGNYILNNRNLYYKMGANESVQTDSFMLTIYHDEMSVIMTPNQVVNNSNLFPLAIFTDSIINYLATNYTLSIFTSPDSLQCVRFLKNSGVTDEFPYSDFCIFYDPETYTTNRFQFEYFEPIADTSGGTPAAGSNPTAPLLSKNKVVMYFKNYRTNVDISKFELSSYVLKNHNLNRFELVEKYKEYQFMTAGFDNNDEAVTRELEDDN